jgi:hypothetical protein
MLSSWRQTCGTEFSGLIKFTPPKHILLAQHRALFKKRKLSHAAHTILGSAALEQQHFACCMQNLLLLSIIKLGNLALDS